MFCVVVLCVVLCVGICLIIIIKIKKNYPVFGVEIENLNSEALILKSKIIPWFFGGINYINYYYLNPIVMNRYYNQKYINYY